MFISEKVNGCVCVAGGELSNVSKDEGMSEKDRLVLLDSAASSSSWVIE